MIVSNNSVMYEHFDACKAPPSSIQPHEIACLSGSVRLVVRGEKHDLELSTPSLQERRICYPVSQFQEEEEEEVQSLAETADAETAERYSDWWGLERYYEFSTDEEDDQVVDSIAPPEGIATPAPPQASFPSNAGVAPTIVSLSHPGWETLKGVMLP